ncbi:MAG: nucleotidyltransferase family protein [Nocardioides sp.]|nr:nucleotidyltransferase family protein [Nocardioides sp.]MDP3892432.1 nucleotidyltransferase family protein [Nocardioides sp.]
MLLAAGGGSRMGTPKALVDDWLRRGVAALSDGGCAAVTVVLGAAAGEALRLLDGLPVEVVVAEDWADGMGASLRAGLEALTEATPPPEAALVSLVDLPDVGPDVVRRLLAVATDVTTLRRAAYAEGPGHPVLLGRDHWVGVAAAATGDRGARDYLAGREVDVVDCSDLATGRDVDAR